MTKTDWVITFTFDVDPPIETMDEWESRLDGFDASVARIPDRGVDLTVYAPGDLSMFDALNKTINEVAHVVQSGPPIGLEVVTEREHTRRAEAPSMPELMSAAEIADELGVRRAAGASAARYFGVPCPARRVARGRRVGRRRGAQVRPGLATQARPAAKQRRRQSAEGLRAGTLSGRTSPVRFAFCTRAVELPAAEPTERSSRRSSRTRYARLYHW